MLSPSFARPRFVSLSHTLYSTNLTKATKWQTTKTQQQGSERLWCSGGQQPVESTWDLPILMHGCGLSDVLVLINEVNTRILCRFCSRNEHFSQI